MDHREIAEFEKAIDKIWTIAQRFGLDPFPVHFEIVPPTIMYEFGAYGLPERFSHWTHGRAYQQIKTLYDYGLSKIYELVINGNPAEAFLLENNPTLENEVVVAHVLGHVDFFKHNAYFQKTDRQMVEGAAIHAERIRQYEFHHGSAEVEKFLDAVLSIQDHVDATARPVAESTPGWKGASVPATAYDDLFYLNGEGRPKPVPTSKKLPPEPDADLLGFIARHARYLEDWQRDIVDLVRSEQLYFVPQMQTKIMNEGWASYWHARIIRELDLSTEDHLEFSRMHAGVLATSRRQINPYYVGMKILEDIEKRWDNPTEEERKRFGRQPGQGKAKLFEVRELESDASFLRGYLTRDLVDELDLYLYRLQGNQWVIVEKDWEKVRDTLVRSVTAYGRPYIVVEDGDYRRNGELYLSHLFEGEDLDTVYAEKTLRYVYQLWGRPVHLDTVVNGKRTVYSYDGGASWSVRKVEEHPTVQHAL